jgi:hypothetical protein
VHVSKSEYNIDKENRFQAIIAVQESTKGDTMKTKTMILCMVTFLFFSTLAWAHPAKSVDLTFDKATKILTATVVHEVKDGGKHFISSVQIKINKRDAVVQTLTLQDNIKGGVYQYKLNDVKVGDTVVLTTTCNFVGKKAATIVIK